MKFDLLSVSKFILYLLGKIFCFILSVILVYCCVFSAKNTINANVVVKDFFSKMSAVVLDKDEDEKELIAKICTQECLDNSGILNDDINSGYKISSYQQRTDVKYDVIFPWTDTHEYVVSNKIEDVAIDYADNMNIPEEKPYFPSGSYVVTVVVDNAGNWYVLDIELTEPLNVEYSLPEVERSADETDQAFEEPVIETEEAENSEL